jgi:hypothetical protein
MRITNAKDVTFTDSKIEPKEGEPMIMTGSTVLKRP